MSRLNTPTGAVLEHPSGNTYTYLRPVRGSRGYGHLVINQKTGKTTFIGKEHYDACRERRTR